MKALVTGGTGFIGSHLVDTLLSEGYTVRILSRPTSKPDYLTGKHIETTNGDLTDRNSLRHACQDIDIIFHCAANPRDWGPRKTFTQINLDGTRNLLDAAILKKTPRFIFMSSAAVYGFPNTTQPITETSPIHPTPKYGESKYQAEQLLWTYTKQHDLHTTAIRSPLVTGPRDRLAAPFLIPAIKHHRFFTIGNGQQTLSLSDGRDVASCLFLAGETHKSNGHAYNVKSFDTTITQLLTTAADALHVPPPTTHHSYPAAYLLACLAELLYLPSRKEPPLTRHKVKVLGHTRILDITKAEHDLGYRPHYGLTHTITDTVTWLASHHPESLSGSRK
jgi:nucleoside-diphosphate-sugar epimerase